MIELNREIEQQIIRAFSTQDNEAVILLLENYPLCSRTTLTAEQAIDLAIELIATANRIQMKEAA